MTPEQTLACAVIECAWLDATARLPGGARNNGDMLKNKREAIAFLTGDGEWGESRNRWCGAIGMDPDKLREKARATLGRMGLAE